MRSIRARSEPRPGFVFPGRAGARSGAGKGRGGEGSEGREGGTAEDRMWMRRIALHCDCEGDAARKTIAGVCVDGVGCADTVDCGRAAVPRVPRLHPPADAVPDAAPRPAGPAPSHRTRRISTKPNRQCQRHRPRPALSCQSCVFALPCPALPWPLICTPRTVRARTKKGQDASGEQSPVDAAPPWLPAPPSVCVCC